MKYAAGLIVAVFLTCALGVPAAAHDKSGHAAAGFDNDRALKISRAALDREVADARFRDRRGRGSICPRSAASRWWSA